MSTRLPGSEASSSEFPERFEAVAGIWSVRIIGGVWAPSSFPILAGYPDTGFVFCGPAETPRCKRQATSLGFRFLPIIPSFAACFLSSPHHLQASYQDSFAFGMLRNVPHPGQDFAGMP